MRRFFDWFNNLYPIWLVSLAILASDQRAVRGNLLIRWWQVHHYVGPGKKGDLFRSHFLRPEQVSILKEHAGLCRKFGSAPFDQAAQKIADDNLLSLDEATKRLAELSPAKNRASIP